MGEPKAPIPPPQPRPVASSELMFEAMEGIASASGIDDYDLREAIVLMSEQVEDLLPSTLKRMASLKDSDDGQVAYSIYGEFREARVNETLINDLAQLSSHIGQRDDLDPEWIVTCVRSFQNYENLCPMSADGSYPEERYSQCAALFDVTHKIRQLVMDGDFDKSELDYGDRATQKREERMIANESLVAFILKSKDTDREKIADIIGSRKMNDPDSIKAIIDAGEVTAISSGAL